MVQEFSSIESLSEENASATKENICFGSFRDMQLTLKTFTSEVTLDITSFTRAVFPVPGQPNMLVISYQIYTRHQIGVRRHVVAKSPLCSLVLFPFQSVLPA